MEPIAIPTLFRSMLLLRGVSPLPLCRFRDPYHHFSPPGASLWDSFRRRVRPRMPLWPVGFPNKLPPALPLQKNVSTNMFGWGAKIRSWCFPRYCLPSHHICKTSLAKTTLLTSPHLTPDGFGTPCGAPSYCRHFAISKDPFFGSNSQSNPFQVHVPSWGLAPIEIARRPNENDSFEVP